MEQSGKALGPLDKLVVCTDACKVVAGSADILPWLNEHHKLLWARSKFSTDIKCDYINNNLAEC